MSEATVMDEGPGPPDTASELCTALAGELRNSGFSRLVASASSESLSLARARSSVWSLGLTQTTVAWAELTLAFAAVYRIGDAVWLYAVAGGYVATTRWEAVEDELFGVRTGASTGGQQLKQCALWLVASVAAAVLAIAISDPASIVVTHLIPAVVVFGGALLAALGIAMFRLLTGRVPGVERGMALVVPIGIVALFVPLFTQELWVVADALAWWPGPLLLIFIVSPLLFFLYRQLRHSVPDAFVNAGERLAKSEAGGGGPAGLQQLWDVGDLKRYQHQADAERLLRTAFDESTAGRSAAAIARVVRRSFNVPLAMNLIPVVAGVVFLMSAYMYALAWVTLDVGVVGGWLAPPNTPDPSPAPTHTLSVLGLVITFPVGPYLIVAAVLGLVATAIFLGSALTQEEYRAVLADNLIVGRVEECLRLALPYRSILEALRRSHSRWIHGEKGAVTFSDIVTGDDGRVRREARAWYPMWLHWVAPPGGGAYVFVVNTRAFAASISVYPTGADRPVATGQGGQPARFETAEGHEYDIVVDSVPTGGVATGPVSVQWRPAPGPANDDFADALPIDGLTGSVEGDLTYATREEGERHHLGYPGGRSIWYRWQAPHDARVLFEASAGDLPALVAVYRGTWLDNLTPVGTDDQRDFDRVEIAADGGREYYVVVDGIEGNESRVRLSWWPATPPDNDDFHDAQLLTGPNGVVSGQNRKATREPDEPEHLRFGGADHSVWYRWVAPETRWIVMETANTRIDTVLAVYTGTELASLKCVAANDDAPGRFTSRVCFLARRGTTYHVAVDGYMGASGAFDLRWQTLSGLQTLKAPWLAGHGFMSRRLA
jgi:hypothetical protein